MNTKFWSTDYRAAISNPEWYIEGVKQSPQWKLYLIDERLEHWISQAVKRGDVKSISELVKLRRPIKVGKMEGARLSASGLDDNEFAHRVGKAIDNHSNIHWKGVVV